MNAFTASRGRVAAVSDDQILDAYRSMSKDLFEMTMSFRPSTWTLFRVLIVPTIVPGILTAWKVNLGNASRGHEADPSHSCKLLILLCY